MKSSKAIYIFKKKINILKIQNLISELKKKNQPIIRYCFHKKKTKGIQTMLIYRKKNSYKIIEKTNDMMFLYMIKGEMKIREVKKTRCKSFIVKTGMISIVEKNHYFSNEIISRDASYLEFHNKPPTILKRLNKKN